MDRRKLLNHREIKILVVGDPGSTHTAKFVNLLQEIGYETEIFQSEDDYFQDEELKNTKIYVEKLNSPGINGNVCISAKQNLGILPRLAKRLRPLKEPPPRVKHLLQVIERSQPNLIISLKMQNDGYTVGQAKKILKRKFRPKWLHFTWGTDIEFFGKDSAYKSEHLPKIKEVLKECDYFLADSKRDVLQAKKFGLRGTNLGQCIATGGFDLSRIIKIQKAKQRKVILIKGRQGGYVGKAFNILKALSIIENDLAGYKIKIIMSTPDIRGAVNYLNQVSKIKYEIVEHMPYQKLLELFGQSLIAISASKVDGSPLFLLEAMAMGAFPIHSDMSSVREWIEDGKNGLLFGVDDIENLKQAIRTAISNPNLIKKARCANWAIATKRMDRKKIKLQLQKLIEEKILKY